MNNCNLNPTYKELALLLFPVGYIIYTNDSNFNPNTYYGGAWEQVKDKFILACGDKYKIGQTGGVSENMLNGEHMPGTFLCTYQNKTGSYVELGGCLWKSSNIPANEWYATEKALGGRLGYDVKYTPLNNMPPYETAYIWKRIS